jgi:hypothetical protein
MHQVTWWSIQTQHNCYRHAPSDLVRHTNSVHLSAVMQTKDLLEYTNSVQLSAAMHTK